MNNTITQTELYQLDQAAQEICDLFDELGFTSDRAVDGKELRAMIVGIIRNNVESVPVVVEGGVKPVPFTILPTESSEPKECTFTCGCGFTSPVDEIPPAGSCEAQPKP